MTHNILFILRSIAYSILASLIMYSNVSAQQNNALYFMDGIPQSNQLNPATQPRYSFYIGMPALSSVEFNAGNSFIGLHDVISSVNFANDGSGSLLPATVLGKLSQNNYVSGEFRIDLLSFGFRVNDSYISFLAGDRIEANGNIPYGFLDFFSNGNWGPGTHSNFNLNGLGINATWYREYSVGYSVKTDDRLTFGIRGKLLFGLANINSQNSTGNLSVNDSIWQFKSNMQINSSIPGLNVYYNGNNLDSLKIKHMQTRDIVRILTNTQNPGFGIDLGFIYKLTNSLSISASVIDLGFIQWHSNVNNVQMNSSYNFNGVNISSLLDSSSLKKKVEFLDTLKNTYSFSHDNDSYITTLSGKIYLGVYLQPLKWIGLGAMSRTQITNGVIDQQYTLSMNLMPSRGFNLKLDYTITENTYDNLGFCISNTIGPFQIYTMIERIPLNWYSVKFSQNGQYIPLPYDEKSINFHFGLNLLFGNDQSYKIRKLKKDKPLVEPEDNW